MKSEEDILNELTQELKDLSKQKKELPTDATKKTIAAIDRKIKAVNKKIDAHKDRNLGESKIKIKFLKSPTGEFNLGYNVGEEGEVDGPIAQRCIDAGYAKHVK